MFKEYKQISDLVLYFGWKKILKFLGIIVAFLCMAGNRKFVSLYLMIQN